MSRRKNDVFSEIIVGLFMVAVLSLLVYFTIVISGVDVLKGRQKVFARVTFASVGGLKDHDNVMYRGTKVGAVEDIEISPSNLTVRIEIDKSVVLREGYRIAVCNLSMLGGNFLLLEEGEGAVIDVTASPLRGETPSDWMQDVATIAKNLNELTSRVELRAIITNLEATTVVARRVADRLDRGEGTLGKLTMESALYDETAALIRDVRQVLDNYRDTTPISTFGSLIMGGL